MSSHRRQTRRRGLPASARVRALLSLGVVLAMASGGTFAYWSDTATVTGTTLTTGRLDLTVNGQDNVAGYSALNLTAMVPGNTTAGVLTIKNNGTVPFTYTMSSAGTNPDSKGLAAGLTAKVTTNAATSGTSPAATCSNAAIAGSGSSFNGALIGAGIKRSLAPGASEPICIQVTLPAGAPASLQGATTTLTFTVDATQIP